MVVCVFVKHIREVITYETSLLCYIATHVKLQAYLNITNQTYEIYPSRTYFYMIIERNISNYIINFYSCKLLVLKFIKRYIQSHLVSKETAHRALKKRKNFFFADTIENLYPDGNLLEPQFPTRITKCPNFLLNNLVPL